MIGLDIGYDCIPGPVAGKVDRFHRLRPPHIDCGPAGGAGKILDFPANQVVDPSPALSIISANMVVVVVLPWAPVMAMPVFAFRIEPGVLGSYSATAGPAGRLIVFFGDCRGIYYYIRPPHSFIVLRLSRPSPSGVWLYRLGQVEPLTE